MTSSPSSGSHRRTQGAQGRKVSVADSRQPLSKQSRPPRRNMSFMRGWANQRARNKKAAKLGYKQNVRINQIYKV